MKRLFLGLMVASVWMCTIFTVQAEEIKGFSRSSLMKTVSKSGFQFNKRKLHPAPPRSVPFLPNSFRFWDNPRFWTTDLGPAYADIVTQSENFVPCEGGPIALCYYSGPEPETCQLTEDGRFANCECFEIPYGPYYVDINAILNYGVYLKTVLTCGKDGQRCQGKTNKAPVCTAINEGKFLPGADLISAFSFACVPEEGIGQTNCPTDPDETAVYAGCMTASCSRTDQAGIVNCSCPTFDGRFQVGNFGAMCTLDDELVWSAAYNPSSDEKTFPTGKEGECFPDAAGALGCPMYKCETSDPSSCSPMNPPAMLPPGSQVDCEKVCEEYSGCVNQEGVEVGFTCDATLCTATSCDERDLVALACSGLNACEKSEILLAEKEAQCSCCASQLCGCEANEVTNDALTELNEVQTARGIMTQCELNETLCGDFEP